MWITGTDIDSVEELVALVAKLFPKRAEYASDYVAIMRFLSNREQFEKIFLEVSQDAEGIYNLRKSLENRNKLTATFHSLFRVIELASKGAVGCIFPMTHEGIVILKGGKIAIQNVTLTGNAAMLFGGIVSRGYLFKDETGPSHGEYAHTLQWLAIAYAKYHGVIKLGASVVDLYKLAAGPGSLVNVNVATLDADTDQLISTKVPVWSFVVDCFRSGERYGLPEDFGKTMFVENYRSPGYLTDQMLHRRLRDTFLGKHIQARYAKRGITTGSHSRDSFRSKWLGKQSGKDDALKFEGTTTNALSPARDDLSELIKDLKTRADGALGSYT
jgi:hypothetical protein